MTDVRDAPAVVRVAGDVEGTLIASAREATDVPVVQVGPTGLDGYEPLVLATVDGTTGFYANCTADRAGEVAAAVDGGDLPDADYVVDDEETATLPTPTTGPFSVGQRHVLAGCGWRRPDAPEDYRAAGGFVGVDADRDDALAAADAISGRGWGDGAQDAPIADAWNAAAAADGDPVVVVNAHGTESDRLLVEGDPFAVLDGAALAARAVGADEASVYLSEADERALECARNAADEFPGDLTVEVVEGPQTYKAAEPTMAIEAIEGNHRLEARLRPPGPEQVGLHGRPTLVHTARTLAHVAAAARDRADGTETGGTDTRVVTVTGDVADAATVELPRDGELGDALEATAVDGAFKAACVGGRFGGLTDALDVGVDPERLSGADLGTEGVVEVLNEDRCVVAFVGRRTQLAADTNCGRCVPCREGSTQLAELLRDLYDGRFDREAIDELSRVVESASICDFGRNVPRPVRTAMAVFDGEFEAHAAGTCPADACTGTIETEATPT